MKIPIIHGVFLRPMWCDQCKEVRDHYVQYTSSRYEDNDIHVYIIHSCGKCDAEYYMEDGELQLWQTTNYHVAHILLEDWKHFLENKYW